jgi:hypothetical protein
MADNGRRTEPIERGDDVLIHQELMEAEVTERLGRAARPDTGAAWPTQRRPAAPVRYPRRRARAGDPYAPFRLVLPANRDARPRLGTALLAEQHDEWLTMGRRYLTQASMTRLIGGVPGTTLSDLLKEGMAV